MKTVNVHQAKTHLSRLIDAAAAGEEIVIARAGKPVVRLVAIAGNEGPRRLGALKGKIVERDDAWAPDPELDALIYGGEAEPPRRRVAEKTRALASTSRRKKK
jgi:prevent-host-death family protein